MELPRDSTMPSSAKRPLSPPKVLEARYARSHVQELSSPHTIILKVLHLSVNVDLYKRSLLIVFLSIELIG